MAEEPSVDITDRLSVSEVVIEGKLLRWGNSYGVRIRKDDVEASGLQPGEQVVVRIEAEGEEIPLSGLPTFEGGRSDTARRHDALLGEARSGDRAEPEPGSAGEDDGGGGPGP